MKKRILALALAGTTAFSVFGAAMSASALDSTHTEATVDAYVSYKPVAKTIVSVASESKTEKTYVDTKNPTHGVITNLDNYMAGIEVSDHYTADKLISVWGAWINAETGKVAVVKDGKPTGSYVAATESAVADAMSELNIVKTTTDGSAAKYVVNGTIAADTLEEALLAGVKATSKTVWQGHYDLRKAADAEGNYIDDTAYGALSTKDAYIAKNIVETSSTTSTTKEASLKVNDDTPAIWAWNADTTGEATIDFTYYTADAPAEVKYQPTIFAYDFVYNNNMDSTAAGVAAVWGDETKAANAIGTHPLVAETGYGVPYKGVRYEVVGEWVDFLEELAINADNGYHETYATFEKMYTDRLYADPVYDVNTGKPLKPVYVDLYNIKGLLKDIYALNNAAAYTQANTSELVYLMQQYDKYIGEYITSTEVNTSDWGALMLSVLESVEADDFSKSADYKKYVNKVEELADAYEDATTVGMIAAAEEGMYELLTTSIKNTSGSKTELAATINSLYFNAKNAPATYATNWKNPGDAQYVNFTYFYASMLPAWGNEDYENGKVYYSLYPAADYKENGNSANRYTGNDKNAANYGVDTTDEYEWFLNVYQLASAMKATSKVPQGALDAIDAALNEAVEALEVTVTPYNATVAAKEDMMDYVAASIKEESDYVEAYYGMYETAVDYAENVAEGEWQNRVARAIVGISGDSLTWQGTQLTITKNEITSLKNAIKEANAAIDAIKNSKDYNAAQVTALNKAIAKAQKVVDIYTGTVADVNINRVETVKVGDKDEIVKSDVTDAIAAIEAAIKGGSVVQGWSQDANGAWMYGVDDEYLNDGWNKIGSVWYYFDEDGTAKQSEWLNLDGKWYWFNSNCGAAIGWAKVDGDWYYFGGNNAMKTGWQKVDGNWYYLAGSGKMTTGWVQVDGKWYYMSKESNSLGQMLSNTTVEGYKLGADGAMIEK